MNRTNPKVDVLLSKASKWQKELKTLRRIVLDCGLTEEVKWGQPCYTFEKKHRFNTWIQRILCASFFQRCAVKRCQGYSHHTNREYAGRAPDSVHQCSRNRQDETHLESLYS